MTNSPPADTSQHQLSTGLSRRDHSFSNVVVRLASLLGLGFTAQPFLLGLRATRDSQRFVVCHIKLTLLTCPTEIHGLGLAALRL